MKEQDIFKTLIIFTVLFSLLGAFFNPLNMFSEQSAMGSIVTVKEIKNNDLYKKIREYNKKHKIPAVDVRFDHTWGAIPGYNGLTFNVYIPIRNQNLRQVIVQS